jgi:hypothetical protein
MSIMEGLKPGARSSREDKADLTTREANRIIAAEIKARDDKTARLRKLRLEQEAIAAEVVPPAPKKAARRTAAR